MLGREASENKPCCRAWKSSFFSVAVAAVEVVRSYEVPAGLHNDYPSFIHRSNQFFSFTVKGFENCADLLSAKNQLVPMSAAVLLGELDGCFADAALVDSGAEVLCLGHGVCGVDGATMASRDGFVKHKAENVRG